MKSSGKDKELLDGYAAIAASIEFQEEHRKKMALHDKWRKVHEFEQQFGLDIRDYLAAETAKKTKVRAPRKKKTDE